MAMNDDDLMHALAHMATMADEAFNPGAEARARTAMHAAIDAAASMGPARRLAARMSDAITTRRVVAAATALAAGAAAVVAVGWSAPVGSPLHAIRVAREDVSLAVPGTDHIGLTLGFAEDRLHQAASGQDAGAALDEAHRLLDDARAQLESHGNATDWSRWNGDEALLASLSGDHPATAAPGHSADDPGSTGDSHGGGGTVSGGPGPSGSGSGGSGSSSDGRGGSSSSTPSASSTSTPTASSTTSGDSRGGSDGSGGSSGGSGSGSTSTPAPTSTSSGSDGGGSRGGPGPGSDGSSSSSTPTSSPSSH